ncbi:MAG: endonuclease/exonuclease/phosphatase family protein [Rhizobiaceae bacterium]|nr:endonuclease/exonuclease/phosphatase family protein [Rhizobiaceae bacterium]
MRLMCLNGWGGTLFAELQDYVRTQAPDVLCLQEAVHSPATDRPWLTYRDGDHVLPQRANFFRDVWDALPDHTATFCPAASGVLWDGDTPVLSQWGLATFVSRSLPVIAQAQDFVFKSYAPCGYGDHPRSRNAHVVRLYDHERHRTITVAHMHGLRDLAGKADTPDRRAQAERFLDLVRRIARPEDLIVVCGDFNVTRDSETLRVLSAAGLTELVTTRGFAGTRTTRYGKPERFADYMLVNRPGEIAGFEVVYQPEVSDHCPLILTL